MLLSAQGICKSFGPTVALDQVSFEVEEGEVHALIGENGSGKSTLMRILHGEIEPQTGTTEIAGSPYVPRSPQDASDRGVSLVHQELAVCPHLTVWENIFLGSEEASLGRLHMREMREKARECLASLGHEKVSVDAIVRDLAPSLAQIVEIARGVRAQSKLILFDEPTSSLGAADVERLFLVIRRLRNAGHAIVYISHFLDEIKAVASRATILRDGRNVGTVDVSVTSTEQMAGMMVGRDLGDIYRRSSRAPGDVVLSAKGLSGRKLPREVSLELRKGEVLGIAGLNGSGRTETVRCLFGLDRRRGEVTMRGAKAPATPRGSWRSGLGFVSEDRKNEGLALGLSLVENLTMTRPGNVLIHDRERDARTQKVIDLLQVKTGSAHQKIGSLSGGNQQKIAIGRLIDSDSQILILDEPTRGIDIGSKAEVYQLIDRLALEGKSVIFVSSYLPELLGLCDRIAVLKRGELMAVLDARVTSEHEVMRWCTGA